MLIQYAPYEAPGVEETTSNNLRVCMKWSALGHKDHPRYTSCYTQQTLPSEEAIADMYEAADVVRALLIKCVYCVHLS